MYTLKSRMLVNYGKKLPEACNTRSQIIILTDKTSTT